MKRDHRHANLENFSIGGGMCGSSAGKATMWSGDELFAVLDYNVKCSDMAEVAQKIEQLEEVMGSVHHDESALSQLASDTVHYNPSDLSSWLESMIFGLNPAPDFQSSSDPSTITTSRSTAAAHIDLEDFGSDLLSIPGKAVYPRTQPPPPPPPQAKRLKTSPYTVPVHPVFEEPARPVVLVDSQEKGVRLVHTLMACAEAVQQEDFKLAEALVKNIGFLVSVTSSKGESVRMTEMSWRMTGLK